MTDTSEFRWITYTGATLINEGTAPTLAAAQRAAFADPLKPHTLYVLPPGKGWADRLKFERNG